VGASGSVSALLVGFGTLFPNLQITALIFFVIPVNMKASTLGWLVIGGSLLFWLIGIERQIGHLAHLGGGIAGFVICFLYKRLGMVRGVGQIPPPIP
jgi:membrane associated rhomboid family serine protease